jgi:hypothetical protein
MTDPYDRACEEFNHHCERALYFHDKDDIPQALEEFASAYSSFASMYSIYENSKKSPSNDEIHYDPSERIIFLRDFFNTNLYVMRLYFDRQTEYRKFFFLLDACRNIYQKLGEYNKSFDREMLENYEEMGNQLSKFLDDPELGKDGKAMTKQYAELAKTKKGIAIIDGNDKAFTSMRLSFVKICKLKICQIPITSYEPPEYSMSLIIGGLFAGVIFWLSGWNFGLAVFIWIGSSAAIAYFVWKDDNKE